MNFSIEKSILGWKSTTGKAAFQSDFKFKAGDTLIFFYWCAINICYTTEFTAENIDVSCAKNFTVDTMLSVIEKHTTSFKGGINIKSFNFAYFFIKNHNAFREKMV